MRKLFTFFRLVYRRDPLLRFIILRLVARCLVSSYRFHWPHLSWWNDELFTAYLKKFDQFRDSNSHPHWMLKQLMKQLSNLSGHAAECGVFKGASSYLICEANQAHGGRRLHHMFDSVDLYQPTMDNLIFFYPRMQPGGVILFDDCGFTNGPGAIAACDEYMQGELEPIIGLPTGGGFLIQK